MNRPFPAGSGRKELIGAFQDDLRPAVDRFKPDLVIVSAGFDSEQLEGLTKVAKGASLALGRDMEDALSRLARGAARAGRGQRAAAK